MSGKWKSNRLRQMTACGRLLPSRPAPDRSLGPRYKGDSGRLMGVS